MVTRPPAPEPEMKAMSEALMPNSSMRAFIRGHVVRALHAGGYGEAAHAGLDFQVRSVFLIGFPRHPEVDACGFFLPGRGGGRGLGNGFRTGWKGRLGESPAGVAPERSISSSVASIMAMQAPTTTDSLP